MIQTSPVVTEPALLHAAPVPFAPSAEAARRSSLAQVLILSKIVTLSALSIPEVVFGLAPGQPEQAGGRNPQVVGDHHGFVQEGRSPDPQFLPPAGRCRGRVGGG